MKQDFIDLNKQIELIEEKQHELSNQITQLKNSVLYFDSISNPTGLLMISNSILHIDELIKCVNRK